MSSPCSWLPAHPHWNHGCRLLRQKVLKSTVWIPMGSQKPPSAVLVPLPLAYPKQSADNCYTAVHPYQNIKSAELIWKEKMRHLDLDLIFTQRRYFLLSEEHFYTTVIILSFSSLFYCFLLFFGFALYWAFFFLFNRLSIFLIVLLLEGLNTRSNPSSIKLSVKQKHTHLPGSQN